MKVCTKSCALAFIFGMGSVASFFTSNKKQILDNLKKSLDEKQLEHYDEIVKNRTKIYKNGLIAGGVISVTLIIINLLLENNMKQLFSLNTLCLIISTTLIVSYLFYMISPKGKYMVSYLKRKDQRDEWVEINKTMQHNYHFAIALAIIAVLFASKIIC
jgi:hypothetical protein